jgi:hypothetical protein
MAQNIGTLISAAIRPNDEFDPIATAYGNEIKGVRDITKLSEARARTTYGRLKKEIEESNTLEIKKETVIDVTPIEVAS